MSSRSLFTVGQWAVAFGIALSIHVLAAWSWFAFSPIPTLDSPAEKGAGLAVGSLSLGSTELPVLTDVASDNRVLAMVGPTPSAQTVVQPVAPPKAKPMDEVLPVQPELRRAEKPTPKPKKPASKAPMPKPKKQQARNPGKPPSAPNVGTGSNRQGNTAKSPTGAEKAKRNGESKRGRAGIDRKVAPQPGNPPPRYPRLARSRGQEGRVLIRVSVLGNGRVASAKVTRSSGHSSLDRAALKAVKHWRFRPALRSGKPVTATLTVPVVFRLEG
jgi:protein TonB